MLIFIGNLDNQVGKANNSRYYINSKKIKNRKQNLTGEQTEKKNSIPLDTHSNINAQTKNSMKNPMQEKTKAQIANPVDKWIIPSDNPIRNPNSKDNPAEE